MKLFRNLFVLVLFACVGYTAHATHNRAGEITYTQIGPLTIRATVTTYTKTSSVQADRDKLTIEWGDGTTTEVNRSVKIPLDNDVQFNQYVSEHTYPGNDDFVVSMKDPNRNEGILNVNPPMSGDVEFFLQTTVHFVNIQFQGFNSSPILLQPPVDIGCVGEVFQHTPNAWDPDGDSIIYELVTPLRAVNTNVPNYLPVDLVSTATNDGYTFDVNTGLFIWSSPQVAGEYNIAMLVHSYRNGVEVGTILRDMQILIKSCNSEPPVITVPPDLCVIAGDEIDFDVTATDSDVDQVVKITATGAPFQITNSPAQLQNINNPDNPARVRFLWNTNCDHVQEQYYQIAFKAEDNTLDTTGLVDFGLIRIRVNAPPPQNVTATPGSGQVEICWDAPYTCASSDKFRGFTVWRKSGCDPVPPDICHTGLIYQGFTMITPNFITASANGRYCFTDTDVLRGGLYTYAVQAEMAPLSAGGFPYNMVASIASQNVCAQLGRDIPLMVHNDVQTTDAANGQIYVAWTKPYLPDLDTIANPGPYTYKLYRSDGFTGANILVAQYQSNFIGNANDTSFIDTGLNTVANPYNYKVEFLVDGAVSLGTTPTASSIFLTVSPSDNANILNWKSLVPWGNYSYEVYRKDPAASTFNYITSVVDTFYKDNGLINGQEYCYYVRGLGSYNIPTVEDTLYNSSQRVCSIPRDNVLPCPPAFMVTGCDSSDVQSPESALHNLIEWTLNTNACAADIERYTIYYAPMMSGTFSPVGVVLASENFSFEHIPQIGNIAGCYYLTATDSIENIGVPSGGNESLPLDTICVDNCPLFQELPNVFTPNGDGANDIFKPFNPYRFIESIDFKVYNRWGELVFETTDPAIGWDGKDQSTGKELAEAVYFYTCAVYEKRLSGTVPQKELLSGYIHLIRN